MADSPNTPPNAPAATPPNTRCPHCDHVFEFAEVVDEWCASCGKKIPEVIMKDIRLKPHLRNPLPLPPPTREESAEVARESRTRAAGLFVLFGATLAGLGCMLWGVVTKMNGESLTPVIWVGSLVLLAFISGLGMFASGRTD